jgi:hypothetical protein
VAGDRPRARLGLALFVGVPRRSRVNFFGKGFQRLGFVDHADGLKINNSSSPSPARLSDDRPIRRSPSSEHSTCDGPVRHPAGPASPVQTGTGPAALPVLPSSQRHRAPTPARTEVATASRPLPVPSGGSASTRTPRILRVLLPMSHIHTAREFSSLVVLGVVLAGDGLFLGSSVLVGAALAAPAALVASYSRRRCRVSAARPSHTSLPSVSSQRARPLAEATNIDISRWENEGGARSPNVRGGESEARRSAR